MKKFYLAHPFDSRTVIREWELRVEKQFDVELLNPFYDIEDRTDVEERDAGRAERYEKIIPSDLVERDIQYVLKSGGLVGIVDGSVSYGTIMEIVYANIFRKPVYLIVTNGQYKHPWLIHHASRIFLSFEEFENWLQIKDDSNVSK